MGVCLLRKKSCFSFFISKKTFLVFTGTIFFNLSLRSVFSVFLPDGLQVPVNGDVDGQAGRLQEVGQQVPLDDPRLGDAHLDIMTQLFHLDPPLAGKTKERRRSRLSGSSTSPLGSSPFLFAFLCSLLIFPSYSPFLFALFLVSYQSLLLACRAEESTGKSAAEVKIVQLSNYHSQALSMEQLVPCIS